jgi:hypothetical protein
MNAHNIVTPSKGTTSYLSFRDEIITIYFGDIRSKVDINIINCRKTHLWTCNACDSLSIKKDSNIIKYNYNKGYDKLFAHIENNHKDYLNILNKRSSM